MIEDNGILILTEQHSAEEERNYTGSFCGFVLLEEAEYTMEQVKKNLKEQWNIIPAPQQDGFDSPMDLMIEVDGAMITVSLFLEPVPEQEAEFAAEHALWQGAKDVACSHKAHLMVAVLPRQLNALEAAQLYCKVLVSCIDDKNTTAIYTSGTILSPEELADTVDQMRRGIFPLTALVHIGTYITESGTCGYTVGMDAFGKDELEILNCVESEAEIHHVLQTAAKEILEQDLKAAWYLRISCDDTVWEGRRKDGVMVEGHSIQFQKMK